MAYNKIIGDDDGWSEWIQPTPTGYKMACCDCGLVHSLNFRVEGDRAQFQAKRHVRATAGLRAWKKRNAR